MSADASSASSSASSFRAFRAATDGEGVEGPLAPQKTLAEYLHDQLAVAGLPDLERSIAAVLIALVLVILSLWLVIKARRALRRWLEPKRPQTG